MSFELLYRPLPPAWLARYSSGTSSGSNSGTSSGSNSGTSSGSNGNNARRGSNSSGNTSGASTSKGSGTEYFKLEAFGVSGLEVSTCFLIFCACLSIDMQ